MGALASKPAMVVLVIVGLLFTGIASNLAIATAHHAPATQRLAVVTCHSSACDWSEFHQNQTLTGVASNSTLSTGATCAPRRGVGG